jgi:type I restriction enzyme, S subunit
MNVKSVQLAEIAVINPSIAKESVSDNELVAFVPMASVSANPPLVEVAEVRPFLSAKTGFSYFQNGDILVAKITPCFENGKIAQAQINQLHGFGSTEFHVVRPHSNCADARYVLHFLRQDYIRLDGERNMTGSAGQRRVPKHFLEALKIPLPPIAHQKRIAAILDQAEALRSHRREAIGLLDELGRSVFLEMFGDPVTNPMGWNRVPFGELLSAIESGKSPNCLDRPVIEGEWGVLKLGAVTWCEYNPAENKALPPQEKPDPTHEVKVGDLLFTRKNTYDLVAACVLVRSTPTRLLLPDLIFRFRLKPDALVDPYFLHQLLIEPRKRREMQKLASGSSSSMPNISKAKLQTILIEVPPLPLQQQFAQRIAAIEALKATQREAIGQIDALFASLQHRAFRGEL